MSRARQSACAHHFLLDGISLRDTIMAPDLVCMPGGGRGVAEAKRKKRGAKTQRERERERE